MSMKIEFEASNSKNLVKTIIKFMEEMGYIVSTKEEFNATVDKRVEELRQLDELKPVAEVVEKEATPTPATNTETPKVTKATTDTDGTEKTDAKPVAEVVEEVKPAEQATEATGEEPQEVAPVEEPTQEEEPTEEVNADEPNSVLMDALNKLREWVVSDKEAVQIRNNAVIGFIRQHGYVEGMKAEDWAKTADPALAPQLLALIK